MHINDSFQTIVHQNTRHTFEHLIPTTISLEGQGREGADINVRISYQTHVFSKAHTGNPSVAGFLDEAGLLREFCPNRYSNSLGLPTVCKDMISKNYLTWISEDRNRASNLAVTGPVLKSGPNNLIVYYLFPSLSDNHDVELIVKSSYEKDIDFNHINRRFNVKQLIKTAHFKQMRVP